MTDSKKSRSKPSLRGSQASFTKKKVSTKTSDIYERFLSRVSQIENDAAKDNQSNIPIKTAALDDDGLDFDLDFTLPTEPATKKPQASIDTDNDFIEADFVVSENIAVENADDNDNADHSYENTLAIEAGETEAIAEPMATQNIDENNESETYKETFAENYDNNENEEGENAEPVTKKAKQAKPKIAPKAEPPRVKTLVVGVICGLVISGSAIAILNSLGVISLQTQNQQTIDTVEPPKAVSVTAPKDSPADTVDTAENTAQTRAEAQSAPQNPEEKTIENKPSATESEPTAAAPNQNPKPERETEPQPNPPQNSNLSYQDFAEEAGTTLYRDTN